jgi:3-oxoacyl-[acyl-carrier-protein] synthase-1
LARALAAGRVKTVTNPVGFMPGEAGAFLLLERQAAAASRGIAPVLVVVEPSFGLEENSFASERPPLGRGLAGVAAAALGRLRSPGDHRGSVFIDVNGEPYRAADWGQAAVRLLELGLLADWPQEVVAASFGETGAASPLLALILAARSFTRGYSRGDTALVLASDDGGNRGATTLHQDTGNS